jgi:hypothetical protein
MKKLTYSFFTVLGLVAFTNSNVLAQSSDLAIANPDANPSQVDGTLNIDHYTRFGDVIYDNGPFITDEAASPMVSLLENTTSGLTLLGTGVSQVGGFSLADEMVLPFDASITAIDFYAYQTGAPNVTSPLTAVSVQIWDGDPTDSGSSIVYGDLTTDVSGGSIYTGADRISETTVNGDRAIMIIAANTTDLELSAGTYWVEWAITGDAGFSGPWAPPITILGTTDTGNALQNNGTEYSPVASGAADEFPQGLPFLVHGVEISLGVNDNLLSQISIFPNPTQDILNVTVPSTVKINSAVLYDVLGKDTGLRLSNGTINTSSLARGVYILNIQTDRGALTEKIVKQ